MSSTASPTLSLSVIVTSGADMIVPAMTFAGSRPGAVTRAMISWTVTIPTGLKASVTTTVPAPFTAISLTTCFTGIIRGAV